MIEVRSEVDKFRGFLQDIVSFEPDFILQTDKPRLHYFDEETKKLLIHELSSQTTTAIDLRNADIVPKDFSTIQAQNRIFFIGGEKKENEIRTVVSNECFMVNEQTYEVERRAPMKHGRSGH
jgi:N-acetylneuraminic acid mutarotase